MILKRLTSGGDERSLPGITEYRSQAAKPSLLVQMAEPSWGGQIQHSLAAAPRGWRWRSRVADTVDEPVNGSGRSVLEWSKACGSMLSARVKIRDVVDGGFCFVEKLSCCDVVPQESCGPDPGAPKPSLTCSLDSTSTLLPPPPLVARLTHRYRAA